MLCSKEKRFATALEGPTLVTDGACNLCAGAASFIHTRLDPSAKIFYMWAQHPDTIELMTLQGITKDDLMQSWALVYKNKVLRGSDAWVAVGQFLTQPWKFVLGLVGFVPRIVRECFYGCVARNRYSIFGGSEICKRQDKSLVFLHSVD